MLVCRRVSPEPTWVDVEHPTVPPAEIFAALTPQQLSKVSASASQMSLKESNFGPLRNRVRGETAACAWDLGKTMKMIFNFPPDDDD
jgi:hypothetical protein